MLADIRWRNGKCLAIRPPKLARVQSLCGTCFSLSFLIVARHAPYRKRGEYHGNRGEHRGVNEWDARVRSPDGGQGDLIQMVSRRKMRDPLRRFRQRKQNARKIDHGQIEQVDECRSEE